MADSEIVLVDASVEVDDEAVTIEGNTIVLVEGNGESSMKAATRGGKPVMVSSQDITTKVGMVKFEMPASIVSMNLARDFKVAGPGRVVRVTGTDQAGNRLGRTLTQGVMTNDPEIAIQNEGKISLEFSGAPLVVS
jgi:hypothetical protein